MVTRRRTGVAATLGLVAVILGVLVLRSRGAEVEIGWFSYDGPPSPDLLDSLVAWNATRAAGAGLVLVGVLVGAYLVGLLAGQRWGPAAPRSAARVLVLAALVVLAGLVAFTVLRSVDRGEATVSISRLVGQPRQVSFASTVWTRPQAVAALVAGVGLVLGAVGTGLRRGKGS